MDKTDVRAITKTITTEVKGALGDKWDEAKTFARSESKKLGRNIAEIASWQADGSISEEQGKILLRMHQRSMKMVLTALEGISLVLAERAVNAALNAIRDVVNGLIGWELI